ncbi:MAG TPA: GNAT family N-acetyltransferase [Bryobacteraceae bacterium]|nr:GNAT family N-acetyltransferase [Bryobacteraceae bacterium]
MILADLRLARRLEAAEMRNGMECTQALLRLRPDSGAAALPVAGGYAFYVGRHSPLTHAIGLGMNGDVRESEVERMEAFFRGRGAGVTVDLCPLADPSLVESLALRGYRLVEFNNLLVRPIFPSDAAALPAAVRRARAGEADLWARTACRGFFERTDFSHEEMEVGLNIFHMSSAECYLACGEQGQELAGAAMAVYDGLAAFFADSTVPEARGRGLHAALIRARLDTAAARGCDLAMASTLPGSSSQRNYERCGFQVVYTRAILAG